MEAPLPSSQAVAHGGEDDIPTFALVDVHQINQQMGDRFILAALAAENDQKLTPAAVEHAVDNGRQRPELVIVKGHVQDAA